MDIGKAKLQVGTTYGGDPAAAFDELYTAFVVLTSELAITPGFADLPASVAIARGQAVNLFSGQLRLADAALGRPAIGICVRAAASGQKAGIVLGMGYAKGLAGLTINTWAYLGNGGALVFAKPMIGFVQGLGYVLSASEMFVNISAP